MGLEVGPFLAADTGRAGGFSGLLGGVLKGDTARSRVIDSSARGASVFPSAWFKTVGFAGILGFSARLTGGGMDPLFGIRSAEFWRPLPRRRTAGFSGGELIFISGISGCGVVGRVDVRYDARPRDNDSLEADPDPPDGVHESPEFRLGNRSSLETNPRGGDWGELTVTTGASCGDE